MTLDNIANNDAKFYPTFDRIIRYIPTYYLFHIVIFSLRLEINAGLILSRDFVV